MTIGTRPDWVDGTQRMMSSQIFLTRYMKEADQAAGVMVDKALGKDEWEIRGIIEEMKGKNMEHLGTEQTVLNVKGGKISWTGLPFLEW